MRRRKLIWWDAGGWRCRHTWHRPLHRLLDRQCLRSRSWPISRWHCCDQWQRCLNHKFNSREFAALHGVQVPHLYWYGWRPSRLPIDQLPINFVIRPSWGTSGIGTRVMVQGWDLLNAKSYADRATLMAEIRREFGPLLRFPLLAEEFLRTEEKDGEFSQVSVYLFKGRVGALQTLHRRQGCSVSTYRFYDADWVPFADPFNTFRPQGDVVPPPDGLGTLLGLASRLGSAYGTFVRADFYRTARGWFFGEFASIPVAGSHFTPWADAYLGGLWQEMGPTLV